MIDIHSHILPGIDDGPETVAQSLAIAQSLVENGYRHVIATPHSMDGSYNVQPETTYLKTKMLNHALKATGIDLTIHPGAEYPLIPELINSDLVTLNNSRYLLVELPFFQPIPQYTEEISFQLQTKGLIPILAHPERCKGLQENTRLLKTYTDHGVLMQVNVASLFGRYGSTIKDMARGWIDNNLVHFLATDSHNPLRYDLLELKEELGNETWDRLSTNAALVLSNHPIPPNPPPATKHKSLKQRIQRFFP